jgi:hypothetical protein
VTFAVALVVVSALAVLAITQVLPNIQDDNDKNNIILLALIPNRRSIVLT